MFRFYFEGDISLNTGEIMLTGENAHQIMNVLRFSPGDEIILFNGSSSEYVARIIGFSGGSVELSVVCERENTAEPRVKISLYQGMPKSSKIESIIKNCVELGVYEIIPMLTDRCVARPADFKNKHERLKKLALESARLSRRAIVPQIHTLTPLNECQFDRHDIIIFAYELEQINTLKQIAGKSRPNSAAIIIGPEGGFSKDEALRITQSGGVSVNLGPRILRTETAGMAALAMLIYEWEGR